MPEPAPAAAQRPPSNLRLRVISSLVLAPVVVGATALGGAAFAAVALVAALGVLWEWLGMASPAGRRRGMTAGAIGLAAAAAAWVSGQAAAAVLCAILGGAMAATTAPPSERGWTGLGVAYAGALLLPALALRWDAGFGLAAIAFLLAVVWATDIAAYFVGRRLGGPKLAPRISPNKTWSGAIGGGLAGTAAGVGVIAAIGAGALAPVAVVALLTSIAAEYGDLFESWMKRRFGAKDSGSLIPGHGGLMDRVDGIIAAALFLAGLGLVRGGPAAPAAGALVW